MSRATTRTVEQPPETNLEKIVPMPQSAAYRVPPPDDDEIALELAEAWGDTVAYFYHDWHTYENGTWRRRHEYQMYQIIRKFLRPYRARGVKVTDRQTAALLRMMRPDVYWPDEHVTEAQRQAEQYINLRNGLYDLETGELVPHRQDLMLTNQLDFDYDPQASCPRFYEFLHSSLVFPDTRETDNDLVGLVLQAMGYSLTARTDLKASFWLYGEPDSGKSTLLSLMKSIMGDLATSIDLAQLGEKTFMLAEIIGKRVVTFPEVASNAMIKEDLYKVIVGGSDDVWTDVKGKKGISFRPISKFWWGMNSLPRVNDRSGALFNRLRLIRFNRSFKRHEQDLNLLPDMIAERSGIFNEIIHHYNMLKRKGWRRVEQSEKKLAEFQLSNDTEKTFINERCDEHADLKVQSSELYSAYKFWCEAGGFRPKNMNQVSEDWRRLGFKDRRSNSGTVWHGVTLKRVSSSA